MSRIGKRPIPIPKDVELKLDENFLIVKGPKGELKRKVHPKIKLEIDGERSFRWIKISLIC